MSPIYDPCESEPRITLTMQAIAAALGSVGILTPATARVGRSSWLVQVRAPALSERAGILRIAEFPESALRDDLRVEHDERVARVPGGRVGNLVSRDDAFPRPADLAEIVSRVLAYFGGDPDNRDRLMADYERTTRRRRGARTRAERKDYAEHLLAEHLASGLTLDDHVTRVFSIVRDDTPGLAQPAALRVGLHMLHILAARPHTFCDRPLGGRLQRIVRQGCYGTITADLSAFVETHPDPSPDDLRGILWDTLADWPLYHRLSQYDVMRWWLKSAPEADLISAATMTALSALRAPDVGPIAHDVQWRRGTNAPGNLTRAELVRATPPADGAEWHAVTELQHRLRHRLHPARSGHLPINPEALEPFRTEADLLAFVAA